MEKCGTCLSFKDPIKFQKILASYEKEDMEILENTLLDIRTLTDEEMTKNLQLMGTFLTKIRIEVAKSTLRKFCKENKFDAVEVGRVERGLMRPSLRMLCGYLSSLQA